MMKSSFVGNFAAVALNFPAMYRTLRYCAVLEKGALLMPAVLPSVPVVLQSVPVVLQAVVLLPAEETGQI